MNKVLSSIALGATLGLVVVGVIQYGQITALQAKVDQTSQCQQAAHEWQGSSVADNAALNALIAHLPTTADDYNRAAADIHTSTQHINAAKAYKCPGAEGLNR